ncbi:MAG: RsfS/YbeB/iojap family protein, partial [Rhizobacter sp.]|nr:RsfS/YbeB/iojap family protein [Chlorobiales bacterium]
LKDAGEAPYHSEGYGDLSWVLLDYVNVVVHIFLKDKRAFYGIETLWGDAKLVSVSDELPAEAAPTKAKTVKPKTSKAVKPKSTTRKTAAPAAKRRTAARKA